MAERIMMTPDELNEGADFLRQTLESIEQEVEAIKRRVDDVCSRWEGAAQQSFINQFETEICPILQETVPEVVKGVAEELDAAANAIRETDQGLASAFSG